MENRIAAFEECGLYSLLMLNVLKNVRVTGDMFLCGNYILSLNSPPDICGLEALFLVNDLLLTNSLPK